MDRWVDRYIDSFTIFVLDICAEIELGIFLLPFSEGGGEGSWGSQKDHESAHYSIGFVPNADIVPL
jgi:hypothetical protein